MVNNQNNTEKGGVLSVQESAQYLGVSRASFWRKAKSDGFPSKVVINNKVGYRPEDLEDWHSQQVANRKAKRSGVPTYECLGRVIFVYNSLEDARTSVIGNADRAGMSKLSALRHFDLEFEKLMENYKKVFSQDSEVGDCGRPYSDFIEAKKEIIKLVWPEIDTDDLTEEDILAF